MDSDSTSGLTESLMALSKHLDNTQGVKSWLASYYWTLMFRVNRAMEKLGYPPKVDLSKSSVLNFGCGYTRTRAISSDLFAIHRYLMNKPRPDLYLTGTVKHEKLAAQFEAIVCEHVLEHIYPSQALPLLRNLCDMLRPNGVIQISVPSLTRFISHDDGVISVNITSINDIAYRYGHKFLHDDNTIIALLRSAGFENARVNSYESSPYREYLSANREPQSIYVIATRPAA